MARIQNHRSSSRGRVARSAACLLSLLATCVGCERAEDAGVVDRRAEATPPIVAGSEGSAGRVWQAVLVDWPANGNIDQISVDGNASGRMRLWLDSRSGLSAPDQELSETIARLRAFHAPVVELDGAWGVPSEPSLVRGMAVRNLRYGLLADLRLALLEEDHSRLDRLLVIFATLPRVTFGHDRSERGLMAVAANLDALQIALDLVQTEHGAEGLDCEAIQASIGWMDDAEPLGPAISSADAERAAPSPIRIRIEEKSIPRIRATLSTLCSDES